MPIGIYIILNLWLKRSRWFYLFFNRNIGPWARPVKPWPLCALLGQTFCFPSLKVHNNFHKMLWQEYCKRYDFLNAFHLESTCSFLIGPRARRHSLRNPFAVAGLCGRMRNYFVHRIPCFTLHENLWVRAFSWTSSFSYSLSFHKHGSISIIDLFHLGIILVLA